MLPILKESAKDSEDVCFRGFMYIVGNGEKARFWHDVWVGECPLKIAFPHLFEICDHQDWSFQRVYNNQGELALPFRRNLGDREDLELAELSDIVANVSLSNSIDSVKWLLERSGSFSTFLYNEPTFTGFSNRWLLVVCLWKTKMPLKNKIFLWQVINDKIQSIEQLKKRNWPMVPLNANSVVIWNQVTTSFSNVCWLVVGVLSRMPLDGPFPSFALMMSTTFVEIAPIYRQSKRVLYLFEVLLRVCG
jgi:hypothetical protein